MIVSLMPGVTFTVNAATEPVVLLNDDFGADRTDEITAKMEPTLLEGAEKLTLHDLVSKDVLNTPDKVLGQVLAGTNKADENITFGYKLAEDVGDVRITMVGQLANNGTGPGNGITAVQLSADGQNWTSDLMAGKGLYLSTNPDTMYLDPDYDALAIKEAGKGKDAWVNVKAEAWAEYTLSLSADGKAAAEKLGGGVQYVRVKFIRGGKLWKGSIREINIMSMPELPAYSWDGSAKITPSDVTQTGAKLTWDAAADASSYRVTRTAGSNTVVENVDVPEITYDDLAAGTEYSVSIDAVHSTGWTISTAPLTGSFTTEPAAVDPEPDPEPEQPAEKVLLLQDTFDDNRTDPEANVYSAFTVDGPLKMREVKSKGSDTKPQYVIGKAMRGQKDAFSGNFAFGYEMEEDITDFEITAWCGMNSNGRDDNFNGTFTLSTDANGANAVTLTKVDAKTGKGDYTATITKEFDDIKDDGAMLEVEIKLTDDGKAKLAAQEGLRYWKFETTKARTWAGIFREVRLYGTREIKTEVFEHKQFVGQDWQGYLDKGLSKNLDMINPSVGFKSTLEGFQEVQWMFRKTNTTADLGEVDFVYSVDAINKKDNKNYSAFSDYNVWIAINGGDLSKVGLSYSTDGQTFTTLSSDTDYVAAPLPTQPKDWPDLEGDKNYTIYELKTLKSLPADVKYFKISVPEITKRWYTTYVRSAFTMTVDSAVQKYDWPESAKITTADLTRNSVTLNWDPIPEVSGLVYHVKIVGGSGTIEKDTTEAALQIADLLPNTKYTVEITALQDEMTVSKTPLTGNFTTLAAGVGESYAMVDTFDNPEDLLSDMVDYGWGDVYKQDGTFTNEGKPLNASDNAIFAQQTVNIGTAKDPKNIKVLARAGDKQYNKAMYMVYPAENLTSFVAEITLGMYDGLTPDATGNSFWVTDSEDPYDYQSYTKLNAVAIQKNEAEENNTARVNTYLSNSIPEGTKYLRIELRNPTNAAPAAMNQIGLKKLKMSYNAEAYTVGEITETARTDNSVSVSWEPDNNQDLTYYFLQDYNVAKVVTGPSDHSYTAADLAEGMEYRFSLVVMNQKDDSEADLSANYVEHSAVMSEDREWFVDRIKFADNALHKMDQETMKEESDKANKTNVFRHDLGSNSIFRNDVNQDGIIVYHVPNMTEFNASFSLSKMRAENVPVFPEFYIAGADKNFTKVEVSPSSFTIPSDNYATWEESLNSTPNSIPEGTEYLKIVLGKSRIDCEKFQQIKIRRKATYDYQWVGGENAVPEVKELTDTTAKIAWPQVADPKPAAYRFDIYKNGIKADTVASTVNEYVFTDLEPGQRYSFGIEAVDTADEKKTTSRIETAVTAYAQENIWGDGMVFFKDYGATSVTLVIPEISDAEMQKYIIRDEKGAVVGEVTSGNEYTVRNLEQGSSVTYTVQAVVTQNGITHYSTLLPARIELDSTLEGWPASAKITMNDLSQNGVTLSWTAFDNMDGRKYRITVTDKNGSAKTMTTESTGYTLSGLQAGMDYDLNLAVVDNDGKKVSYDLAIRFSTLRVTEFFTSFRAADLTYADTEEWEKCDFYTSAGQIPNLVATNKVNFERKYAYSATDPAATDPLGPVFSGFYRAENTNVVDAYIVYDKGETLSEIVVRSQQNDTNKGAVEANRPRIEYALDDGKPQSVQGNFNPNDYTWTELDYANASMEVIGTTGEYYNGKRKADNEIIETTVTNLPEGARYFRVYVPQISNADKKAWRQWLVGIGGKLYDEVTAALQNYDFNKSLTGGDTMSNVSHDVNFPSNIDGYEVSWTSDNEKLIGVDGKVHSENITPGYYGGKVTFTASIYRYPGDKEPAATKSYTVDVYKNTDGWTGEDFINYDLALFTDVNQFTAPQPAAALAVTVETPLPTGVENGSSFSWSIKEETEYAKIEEGKLVITQKLGEDVPLTLVLTATRDGASVTREYPINIIQSYGTPITDGKIEVSSGRGKDNVKKPGFGAYWASEEDDAQPYIQYKLSGSYSFMTVVLGEVGDNVQSFKLMTSEDEKDWTTVYSGQSLGHAKQIAIPLAYQKPQYFRAEFTPKAGGTVKIAEFLLLDVALSDQQIVDSTFSLIDLPRTTTKDLELEKDWLEGVTVSWKSSNTSVISDTGKVTRGDAPQTVTMTATVTYNGITESRDYTVTVLKKNSSGGSISGGGSSGSGGGGGGLPYVPGNENPVQPNENENINQNTPYKDVSNNHWAYGYIKTLTDKKVVSGSGDGYFYPENSVTREEFLKMILSAANIQVSNEAVSFADVDGSAWYAPYVATAYKLGIVKGIDENRFGIGENIQRQDMAVMADRMLALMEKEAEGTALDYNDKAEISDYAVSAVENLAALEIMNGDENQNFLPRASATRAESAKIVCVMSELAE